MFLIFVSVPAQAICSSLAAGKKVTSDKSVLFGHNEDDGPCPTPMHVVPRINHEPGETIELRKGGLLEHVVGDTWAYIWSQMPGYNMNSAHWVFRKMANLDKEDYLARRALVRGVWDEYEAAAFDLQDRIEKTALQIYDGKKGKKGKKSEANEYLARWFLTRHTESLALNAYDKALAFIELFEAD